MDILLSEDGTEEMKYAIAEKKPGKQLSQVLGNVWSSMTAVSNWCRQVCLDRYHDSLTFQGVWNMSFHHVQMEFSMSWSNNPKDLAKVVQENTCIVRSRPWWQTKRPVPHL